MLRYNASIMTRTAQLPVAHTPPVLACSDRAHGERLCQVIVRLRMGATLPGKARVKHTRHAVDANSESLNKDRNACLPCSLGKLNTHTITLAREETYLNEFFIQQCEAATQEPVGDLISLWKRDERVMR